MSTTDFSESDPSDWIAVLPLAAVEQHGPHLPCGVDSFIAQGLVDRVVGQLPEDLPTVFLPVQTVGKSDEHMSFSGTLSLGWETALRAWLEIGASVARAGVKKLVVVTSHGGNSAIVDLLVTDLRLKLGMLAVGTTWAGHGNPPGIYSPAEEWHGIHAGDIETSLMLAFRPDLVDLKKAANHEPTSVAMERDFAVLRTKRPAKFGWAIQDLHPSGVAGNALAATREKGERTADHYAAKFIELLRDVDRFDASKFAPTI